MKLLAFDLPEDSTERTDWLERQLVGLELRDLVVSLRGLTVPSTDELKLEQILKENLDDVLEQGLSVLDPEQIRRLLVHPLSLLELQEQIFIGGGEYWNLIERTDEHEQLIQTQTEKLETKMSEQALDTAEETPAPEPATLPKKSMPKIEYVASLIAAVLLVGVMVWMTPDRARTGWGFNRPGALERQLPAEDYLNHLASAAKEWFSQRPGTEDALAVRLRQFIDGCETLIDAPHPQLEDEDRDWLRERCESWKATLEEQLAELESGTKTVEETRDAADETINKLMTALRGRAKAATG